MAEYEDITEWLKGDGPSKRHAYIRLEEAAKEIEALRQVVKFIASDYIELSYDKIEAQRNDWRKRCIKVLAKLEHFKCPLNDPECKENCGSYGCGN
jgi:guanylate kinase